MREVLSAWEPAVVWKQIVIGNGSSALNFLQSALNGAEGKFKSDEILVIGKTDLWSRTTGGHAMGQTPALLQRQISETRPTSAVEGPKPVGLASNQYLTSGAYTDHLAQVRGKLIETLPGVFGCNDNVIGGGVKRSGTGFRVTVSSGESFDAAQVIVANGIGPPATLPTLDKGIAALSQVYAEPRGYPEIVDAVTYYNSNPPTGLDVLVYGGSATSSWAANHAWKAGEARILTWMCRRGIDAISTEGNPVGRNSEVIQMAVKNGLIHAGEIDDIWINLGARPEEGRLMVKIKIIGVDPDAMTRTETGGVVTLTKKLRPDLNRTVEGQFHQVVYAVGSNPMGEGGPGNILDAPLRGELGPVYAKDHQFMTGRNDVLIALSTPDEGLWVVGAAVFGGVGVRGLKDLQTKYSKVGTFMPTACTPPEGIAILSATIDALTGHRITDPAKFDWNRARPDEIVGLFKTLYGIDDRYCTMIARVLVDRRRDSKFALPRADIEKAVADVNQVYRTGMDVALLQLDRTFAG
jgi:hypothetical protein